MIILGVSLKQNLYFKIQMLVGNSLNSFLDLRSKETTTLIRFTDQTQKDEGYWVTLCLLFFVTFVTYWEDPAYFKSDPWTLNNI